MEDPAHRRLDWLDPRPFALALTLGVLLVHGLPDLPPWWTGFVVAVPALLPWRGRLIWSGFVLGFLLSLWNGERWQAQRWPESRQGESALVAGRVVSLPSSDGDATRFLFAPDDGKLPRLIRVGWYHSDVKVRGGDCWTLDLRMHAPRGALNPGGFDYEAWLYRQDIGALATAHGGEPCTDRHGYWILRAREAIREQYARWLPQHPARGFIAALTLGDQSELNSADWEVFQTTGTIHLVVIAGLHVGIIAGSLFFLLRWLWSLVPALCLRLPAQRAAAIGAAVLALGYALLAGFETPAMRASLMVVLALVAALLSRRASASRILALAWTATLLLQPGNILSPGLWLSFGAVAAIGYINSGRLGPIPAWRQLLAVQLVLSAALAPLTLFFFEGLSWIAPLVNIVIVPALAVLMPALAGALLLALLWPGAGVPALGLMADIFWKLHEILAWLAAHLSHPWWLTSAPPVTLLLAGLSALLLCAPRGLPVRPLGLILLLPLLLPMKPDLTGGFRVVALDVGQGLALVVRTAQHCLVFDTGAAYGDNYDAGRNVVVPYLVGTGIGRPDLMIVSHADLDHRGGAPSIRRLLPPREELGAVSARPCRDGQQWIWDGIDFRILNPPADGATSRNNSGCVLRISDGVHVALLPADIEAPAERRLLQEHPADLRADLLIAPHHGSKSSSTDAFVAQVHPKWVLYSAGFANSYHLPRREVVERYRALGVADDMTGTEGALSIDIDPKSGLGPLIAWRRQASHFWNAPVMTVQEN